jgi:hypothetical protein
MVKTFYVDEEHHRMLSQMAKQDERSFKVTLERIIESAYIQHQTGSLARPAGGENVPVITRQSDWQPDDKGE